MSSGSLMSAVVRLKPDVAAFRKELIAGVEKSVDDAERRITDGMAEAGDRGGERLADGISDGAHDGARKGGKAVEDEFERAGENASKSLRQKLQGVENVGRKMSLFVTAPIVAGFGASIKAASNLGEAVNANNVIFGSAATGMQTWAKGTLDTLGLAQSTSLSMVNQIGAQMTAQGISQEKAAQMSMELVARARDVKSLLNASSTEEVMTAIAAGLRGESEPLRRFGVSLSQAAIEAQALSMGLVSADVNINKVNQAQIKARDAAAKHAAAISEYGSSSQQAEKAANELALAEDALASAVGGKVGDLTEAQKIQAAYALVMEQSAAAEGDYANTKGSEANATETLSERTKDLAATFGKNLLPVAEKVVGWANRMLEKFNNLSPSTQKMIAAVAGLAAVIGPVILIGAKFAQALMALKTAFMAVRAGMMAMNLAFAANPIGLIVVAIVAALAIIWKFRDEIGAFIGFVVDRFREVGPVLLEPFKKLGELIKTVFTGALDVVKGTVNFFLSYWETMINAAIGGVNLLIRGANLVNPFDDIPSVGNISLPRLATGGTVYPDGRIVQLAEGGQPEDVVPHSKRGAYAAGIVGGTMDALASRIEQLAEAVAELAGAPRALTVQVVGRAYDERELARQLDELSRRTTAVNGRTRRPNR